MECSQCSNADLSRSLEKHGKGSARLKTESVRSPRESDFEVEAGSMNKIVPAACKEEGHYQRRHPHVRRQEV